MDAATIATLLTFAATLVTAAKLMFDRQERQIALLATSVAECTTKHVDCEIRATAAEVRIQFLERTSVRKTQVQQRIDDDTHIVEENGQA